MICDKIRPSAVRRDRDDVPVEISAKTVGHLREWPWTPSLSVVVGYGNERRRSDSFDDGPCGVNPIVAVKDADDDDDIQRLTRAHSFLSPSACTVSEVSR